MWATPWYTPTTPLWWRSEGPALTWDIPEVRVFTFFRVFPCREINCFLVLVFITNFDQFFLKFFTREARKKLVVLWCFWLHFEVHAQGNNSETVYALFSWSVKIVANDTLNKNCNTGCSEILYAWLGIPGSVCSILTLSAGRKHFFRTEEHKKTALKMCHHTSLFLNMIKPC